MTNLSSRAAVRPIYTGPLSVAIKAGSLHYGSQLGPNFSIYAIDFIKLCVKREAMRKNLRHIALKKKGVRK